jgi:hypothetical protein
MMTESNHIPDYEIDTIDELNLDRRQPLGDPQDQQESLFSTVDDETMVRRFARGKKRSVSNHNLAINYTHNSLQLSTPQGELIALNKISDKLHYILLKQDSNYWEFIHHLVIEHSFVPINDNTAQGGFTRYQKYQIPPGYQLKYTNAKDLLDLWQQHSSYGPKQQLDLLFLSKSKWYRVKSAVPKRDKVLLTSVAGQIEISVNTEVPWIYQLNEVSGGLSAQSAPVTNLPIKSSDSDLLNKLISKLGVEEEGMPAAPSTMNSTESIDPDALALFEQVFNPNLFPDMPEEVKRQVVEMQISALRVLENYIEHGETITKTEIISDNSGKKISEKTITTNRGCPRWVIESLLQSQPPETPEIEE